MKLIKLTDEHYVIVDETIQPVNGWYYDSFVKQIRNTSGAEYSEATHCWQITHSTQPLEYSSKIGKYWGKVMPLTLTIPEIKELIGEVDVEKDYVLNRLCVYNKRNPNYIPYDEDDESRKPTDCSCDNCFYGRTILAEKLLQLNQALEDNKEKKYTEEDLKYMFECGRNYQNNGEVTFQVSMEYLQPKTEWEVEFENGKLKLK